MSDFVTFGELLIDFTPSGEKDGRKLYMQNAGGAVANAAAAISRLGIKASFMGMVGNDEFGKYLEKVLQENGVDTHGLIKSDEYNTTLAFVHLFDNGERDFSFYRKPCADIMFTPSDIDESAIKKAKVFHFGSLSLTDEPSRSATFKALETAKQEGVLISYDPNYRAPLWNSLQEAKKYMLEGLKYADIVKISDNEIEFLFGDITYEQAVPRLLKMGIKLVFITLGSKGSLYANSSGVGRAKGYKANAVDGTGAGDCFTASVIYQFMKSDKSLECLTLKDIAGFADFANAAASICVEGKGGIPSMPSLVQVEKKQRN